MKTIFNNHSARWRASRQATAIGCPQIDRAALPSSDGYVICSTSDAFAMLTLVDGRPGSSG